MHLQHHLFLKTIENSPRQQEKQHFSLPPAATEKFVPENCSDKVGVAFAEVGGA